MKRNKISRAELKRAFTLIELLVVVAIIGLLASVVIASLSSARAKGNDARRLADMRTIQTALELYYDSNGNQYPNGESDYGGWDTPENGKFIPALVPNYLSSNLSDPSSPNAHGNYCYSHFGANSNGCTSGYYVLRIMQMQTGSHPNASSPGWKCPGLDYQQFGDWVTGKSE